MGTTRAQRCPDHVRVTPRGAMQCSPPHNIPLRRVYRASTPSAPSPIGRVPELRPTKWTHRSRKGADQVERVALDHYDRQRCTYPEHQRRVRVTATRSRAARDDRDGEGQQTHSPKRPGTLCPLHSLGISSVWRRARLCSLGAERGVAHLLSPSAPVSSERPTWWWFVWG